MCVCVCVCCVCERVGSDVLQFLFPGTVRCNEERRVMKDNMTRTGYSDVNGPAVGTCGFPWDLSRASLAALAAAFLIAVRVCGSAPKAEVGQKTPGTENSKTECTFKNNNECNAMTFEN